jgi:predicted nucleic acid-binding protein
MALVCLDTQIVYWSWVDNDSVQDDQRPYLQRTHQLLTLLEKQKDKVIIPSIVVAEMLVSIPQGQFAEAMSIIQSQWRVGDFDLRAAGVFAQMRQHWKERLKGVTSGESMTKAELKADLLIAATAVAHGCDILYSHDTRLRSMCEGFITAKDLPELDTQMRLL